MYIYLKIKNIIYSSKYTQRYLYLYIYLKTKIKIILYVLTKS